MKRRGRKLFNHIILLMLMLSVFALFGCQTTSSDTKRVESHRTIDNSHPNALLVIGSDELVDGIKLLDPKLRKVGVFTQGQVTVQNVSDTRLSLEYKFNWEDATGFVVDEDSMWHRFALSPRQVKRFQSTGKSQDAAKMVFTVRYPDDVFIEYDRRYQGEGKEESENE